MLRMLCFVTGGVGRHDVESRGTRPGTRAAPSARPPGSAAARSRCPRRGSRRPRRRTRTRAAGPRGRWPRRRRGRRHVVAAVEIAEVRLPPEGVGVAAPHREPVLPARRRDLAVVEHGLVEELEGHRHLAAVARAGTARRPGLRPRSRPSRRCSSGRCPAPPRARRSTAVRGSSLRAVRGTASRARAILDRHADEAELRAQLVEERVVHQVRADHVAAAVHRVHARQHARRRFGPMLHRHRRIAHDVITIVPLDGRTPASAERAAEEISAVRSPKGSILIASATSGSRRQIQVLHRRTRGAGAPTRAACTSASTRSGGHRPDRARAPRS